MTKNYDLKTVKGFGEEWARFDQSKLSDMERSNIFNQYFSIFPWEKLPKNAVGFDLGCGSGRWAPLVAPRVTELHCIDPSEKALEVARKALISFPNVYLHLTSVDAIPLSDGSMDFGYSLGVLHHVPNTFKGICSCSAKLKPGAPFLLYLYYALDNRPLWFRAIFFLTQGVRRTISKLPQGPKNFLCQVIAACLYYPLAKCSKILEKIGISVRNFPLSFYRDKSFFVMQTDALDRFGTRLEQRFTQGEIQNMMKAAGFTDIKFSNREPYWVAVGIKQ
ncbi:hypothetical protein HCUR_00696 [Holospora curviuscula]|uniref:Methyltransferase type 11 domain-containing protein n=2 Tax=Holospora curviuscula TaxID=1082868 RepID=A0A2S5R9B3_9PROT|nr:hypothetical protein HCUR_00696 [Holospora curviuscula]